VGGFEDECICSREGLAIAAPEIDPNVHGVPWTHERLTVESSSNFRDWRIRYHSRTRTSTVNERNSNGKPLKENLEETMKNMNVFQIVGKDQMEQKSIVIFLRLKDILKKAIHDELIWMLQENAFSYSTQV
jgi:hypothetical protein